MKVFIKSIKLIHILSLFLIGAGFYIMDSSDPEAFDYLLLFFLPIMMIFLVNDIRIRMDSLKKNKKPQ